MLLLIFSMKNENSWVDCNPPSSPMHLRIVNVNILYEKRKLLGRLDRGSVLSLGWGRVSHSALAQKMIF